MPSPRYSKRARKSARSASIARPQPTPPSAVDLAELAEFLGTDAFDAAIAAEIQRRALERAERDRAAVTDRCRTLAGFIREAWHVLEPLTPYQHNWHIDLICAHLEAVTRGEIARLWINIPPGFAKSLIVSVFWPAWEWGPAGLPSLRYLSTAHKESLAIRDNTKMRRLVESDWYRTLWGDTVKLAKDQNAKGKFETTATGSREAMAFISLTGGRGDRVIVDDPNSTESAESDAQRAEVERIVKESLPSRVNDLGGSAIVGIMQRLHTRDATGVLQSMPELGYVHLILPMRFDPERAYRSRWGNDPRTEPGELLFPGKFPEAEVVKLERSLGTYGTAGQLQQTPVPREGGMFRRSWFGIVPRAPLNPEKRVRAWDLAGTKPKKGTDPDWTAGVRVSKGQDGCFYVEDLRHLRDTPGTVRATVKQTADMDGLNSWVRMTKDPGQAGVDQTESYSKLLAGHMFHVKPATGSKEVRAEPAASAAENGLIYLVEGPWNETFLDEVCNFPNAPHDDITDAFADAFNECAGIVAGEGLMEWYRQQAELAMRREAGERDPVAPTDMVALIPPPECQTAYGADGTTYVKGPDGIMWVRPDDAPGFAALMGWRTAPSVTLGEAA